MMWVRSFILHFKKILLFAAVIIAVTGVMNYLYVDDTDAFSRYVLHEFYEETENIDRLYLGSSHVFCDINPVILDGINGDNNFDLATSSQQLNTSYYLLREADKKHHIDRVYLDLYYYCMTGEIGKVHDYRTIPNSWKVIYQMKPSLNKLSYMLGLSAPEYYYMTFLAFMRYREELFNPDYVARIVEGKQSDTWKNYEYLHVTPGDKYAMTNGEKGFRVYHGVPDPGGFCTKNEEVAAGDNPMILEPESLEYLLKIVEYCKKHDIALTWIGCPISDFLLITNGNYDCFSEQIRELAEKYEVPYYDFSLCKREYLDVSRNEYWSDIGHLNTDGAGVFSPFLGKFLLAQETGENTYDDCFYGSYEEKLREMQEEIFGLEIVRSQEYGQFMPDIPEEERDGYTVYKIRPVTNAAEGNVEITVKVMEDAGGEGSTKLPVIREGNDAYVILSKEEHGEMLIEAKLQDSLEVTNWCQIEY